MNEDEVAWYILYIYTLVRNALSQHCTLTDNYNCNKIISPSVNTEIVACSIIYINLIRCWKYLRSMGTCAELLLLHFSAFTIGRRLEVTVSSKEESLLQPSIPYSPSDMYPSSAMPSHVITVSAPKPPPRYQNTYCCLRKNTNPKIRVWGPVPS